MRMYTPSPHPEGMIISADTVHLTLKAYVDVFVHTAEDSYNRRVTVDTVISFLDALRGLVCISHILLDDALEVLSQTHPRDAFNFDVKIKSMRGEFDLKMAHLEHGITKATYSKSCQMVLPTILKGVEATKSLLGVMAVRRQRALEKAKKVVP
ncbi:uncharacterized protein LOC8078522 [Sorghum bicolor]|nr:uncharacterized protein LOC8078522 [Sorghum bicolor]|eukprot:XP_021308222.1 uncharacterized protein LOC8078522 [Sorghum bicolor]